MHLRMSVVDSSLICHQCRWDNVRVVRNYWSDTLANRTCRTESRASHGKSIIVALTCATLLRRTLSEDAWGVREKCAPNNSREKNGAWSETGKRAGKEKVTRVSERTKGYLTRAMTATIVSNASKQCRRRVPGTESRSFWRGPSFRLAPVCERAFPFLGISIICGPAADSRQIYPRFATENEQCLFLVFFPVLFYHCVSRNSVTYTRGREKKREGERERKRLTRRRACIWNRRRENTRQSRWCSLPSKLNKRAGPPTR